MASVAKRPFSIWWIQAAYFTTGMVLIAVWIFLIPLLVTLPEEVAIRIRIYPVFMLPLMVLLHVGNHFWLTPLNRHWQELLDGKLDQTRVVKLISRAARYPYHAFVVSLVGVLATAATVTAIQTAAFGTSLVSAVELFALAAALGVVLAMASFMIGRLAMEPMLQLPDLVSAGFRWGSDQPKRVVIGSVCAVLVVWTIVGVMVFDSQTNLATALVSGRSWHPIGARTAVFLVMGGLVFLLISGGVSWLAAKDLLTDTRALASGLERLATEQVVSAGTALPVLSPDEIGEMTEAFNRLVERVGEHEQLLRRRAEEAAEADRRQMEFLTAISHDLRTPLNSIVGFSQLLAEGTEGELNPEQQEDVGKILKAGHHLLSLVDDVVDISKIESGMMALSRRAVDIGEVVHEALQAASGLPRGRLVRLDSRVPSDLPKVYVDETRLRQVLFNLVGNALKFTNEGAVSVRVDRKSEEMVEVAVEDTGPGIPEDSLGRIFEEFEQVRIGSADPAVKGTGLGLAITRRLVEMHGGEIQVSNRPGGGAVFIFTIPVFTGSPDLQG